MIIDDIKNPNINHFADGANFLKNISVELNVILLFIKIIIHVKNIKLIATIILALIITSNLQIVSLLFKLISFVFRSFSISVPLFHFNIILTKC